MDRDSSSDTNTAIFKAQIQALIGEISRLSTSPDPVETPEQLDALEQQIHALTRQLADHVTALKIQQSIDGETWQDKSHQLIKSQPKKQRNVGKRRVNVRFFGGTRLRIEVSYYTQKSTQKKGRGWYPSLILLGIHDRCTPTLASEVSLLSSALCSFKEAQHLLETRGCCLNIKTLRHITKRYAARARCAQQRDEVPLSMPSIEGRRVVISTDGGRVRIRRNKPGRKTKKGRRYLHTDWKEPKLMIIYLVNEEGRLEPTFSPFIDGTLSGPEAIFGLMKYYLTQLNITQADKVMFVGDGARWIWTRVKKLFSDLGLAVTKVVELLDFYHAMEHINALAKLKKSWSSQQKKTWTKKCRNLLLKGQLDTFLAQIKLATKNAKGQLKTERNYFLRNQHRLDYLGTEQMQLPRGSGAIESAIRRVINLRLKGAGIYWLEDTASEMLLLRSYYKAGRWNLLKNMANVVTVES